MNSGSKTVEVNEPLLLAHNHFSVILGFSLNV